MLAYLASDWEEEASTIANDPDSSAASVVVKIEKMVKQFKCHRCALDFDIGFIKSTVIESWVIIIINVNVIVIIIVAVREMTEADTPLFFGRKTGYSSPYMLTAHIEGSR